MPIDHGPISQPCNSSAASWREESSSTILREGTRAMNHSRSDTSSASSRNIRNENNAYRTQQHVSTSTPPTISNRNGRNDRIEFDSVRGFSSMEKVFFKLHYKFSIGVSKLLNVTQRAFLEYLILLTGFAFFTLLYVLHSTYVNPKDHLLKRIFEEESINPRDIDLLYIKVITPSIQSRLNVEVKQRKEHESMNGQMESSLVSPSLNFPGDDYPHQYPQNCTTTELKFNKKKLYHLSMSSAMLDHHMKSLLSKTDGQLSRSNSTGNDIENYQLKVYKSSSSITPEEYFGLSEEEIVSERMFIYSFEKGLLTLPTESQDRFGIRMVNITTLSTNEQEFGSFFQQCLFEDWIGFDTVVTNWIVDQFDGIGFIYSRELKRILDLRSTRDFHLFAAFSSKKKVTNNQKNKESKRFVYEDTKIVEKKRNIYDSEREDSQIEEYDIHTITGHDERNMLKRTYFVDTLLEKCHALACNILVKSGLISTTLFLFFSCTTLVHFILRETQDRMLQFTLQLNYCIRNSVPYAKLIFSHVTQQIIFFVPITIGIYFFLSEFYGDNELLAFMVLSGVWVSEIYSVLSARTIYTINFFPKIFFVYFVLFHVYYFSHPFGFGYLAFLTNIILLLHTFMFFWNRYELPALQASQVNERFPRQGVNMNVYEYAGNFRNIPTNTESVPTLNSDSSMIS